MALCRATWVCFTQGAETLCSPTRVLKLSAAPLPFCVALSLSVHLHMHFYITALFFFSSSRISSVAIMSRADMILTLHMNIELPLFGALESGPGPYSAIYAGLEHGQ